MENEQPTQYNYQEPQKKKAISTGAALILGISGIIIAAIIAGAIIFASGARTVRYIDFEKFDGFEILLDENGEETTVQVNTGRQAAPGDPIPGNEGCPPFCDEVEQTVPIAIFQDEEFDLFTFEYENNLSVEGLSYGLGSMDGETSALGLISSAFSHRHADGMYGSNPKVQYTTVSGQEAGYIVSSNSNAPSVTLFIVLPEPLLLDSDLYTFLQIVITGDQDILDSLLTTFEFL